MTITALSAAISSFSGLQSLAEATGWPEPLSFLLPCTIDAYAMTATRVWLSSATPLNPSPTLRPVERRPGHRALTDR